MTARLEHLDAGEVGELRGLFFAQAVETLDQVQQALLRLERDGAEPETVRVIKRALHTTKGDATSMGFEALGRLCHRLEDVLAALCADPRAAAAGLDLLFAGVDAVEGLLAGLQAGADAAVPPGLEPRIAAYVAGGDGDASGGAAPERSDPWGAGHARESLEQAGRRREVVRIEADKLDAVLDLVGELVVGRSMLDQAIHEAEGAVPGAEFVARLRAAGSALERTVGDLQKRALRMRMVPLRYVFRKFPRVVRDLAHQLGKQARLEIEGQDTELDKGIVDALFEPLTHLVRNMVDHGIEAPAARVAAGKGVEGRITLRAFQEAAHVVVEVADDGAGIDAAKLVRRAVERGCLAESLAPSLAAPDALQLVFLSGVSTADGVSETSGRGVGMDAVRSALEAVKGSVEVESLPGEGTCFRLRLPMTLAVIRSLLFDAGARRFALPLGAIAEVVRVPPGELVAVDGRPCLQLRDRIVSVIPLGGLVGAAGAGDEGRFVLVLALRGRRFGVLVERLRGQQELVIKAVDERWIDGGVVSGAAILGDGTVVPVLDAAAVVARAIVREKAGCAAA